MCDHLQTNTSFDPTSCDPTSRDTYIPWDVIITSWEKGLLSKNMTPSSLSGKWCLSAIQNINTSIYKFHKTTDNLEITIKPDKYENMSIDSCDVVIGRKHVNKNKMNFNKYLVFRNYVPVTSTEENIKHNNVIFMALGKWIRMILSNSNIRPIWIYSIFFTGMDNNSIGMCVSQYPPKWLSSKDICDMDTHIKLCLEYNNHSARPKYMKISPIVEIKRRQLYNYLVSEIIKHVSISTEMRINASRKKQMFENKIRTSLLSLIYAQKSNENKNFKYDPVFAWNIEYDSLFVTIRDYTNDSLKAQRITDKLNLKNKMRKCHDKMLEFVRNSNYKKTKVSTYKKYIVHKKIQFVKISCIISNNKPESYKIPLMVYNRLINISSSKDINPDVLIWCILCRYTYLGGINHHLAVPPTTKNLLNNVYNLNTELFASMINCQYTNFCSVFYDIEKWFGSLGNHFDILPSMGWVMSNPPYEEHVMLQSIRHCINNLSRALKKNKFLSYIVTIPVWDISGKQLLNEVKNNIVYGKYMALWEAVRSGYLRDLRISSKYEHEYLDYFIWKMKQASSTYTLLLCNYDISPLPSEMPGRRVNFEIKSNASYDSGETLIISPL